MHQHKYLQPGKPFKPDNIKGSSFEMEVVISPMNSDKVGVKVLCSPDMKEYTVIEYDQRKRTLSIDSTKSSLSKKIMRVFPNCYSSGAPNERELFETTHHRDIPVHTAPLHLEEDDMLKLDIFVDNSIIEVFANNRQMITGRVYPTRADSREVYVFSEGGDGWAHSIRAWDMKKAGVVK
jgi:beta-fructofuranosidase